MRKEDNKTPMQLQRKRSRKIFLHLHLDPFPWTLDSCIQLSTQHLGHLTGISNSTCPNLQPWPYKSVLPSLPIPVSGSSTLLTDQTQTLDSALTLLCHPHNQPSSKSCHPIFQAGEAMPWWSQPWPEPTQLLLSTLGASPDGWTWDSDHYESHWWNNQWLLIKNNHRNSVNSYYFFWQFH